MSSEPTDDFGTQVIQPVAFRYPTAWQSWQAVLGDLAREHDDARLTIEAAGAETGTAWTAMLDWGDNSETASGGGSLHGALHELWRAVTARHPLYDGDTSKRGPAQYEPHETLDVGTQAALQRLLGVVRAAFDADWKVIMTYSPVAQAEQRIHAALTAQRGGVDAAANGPTLTDGARGLMRAAAPHFPKPGAR